MGMKHMFERIKIIKGREYKYLVKNEREGKNVKQRVVKYLGPVKPVYKNSRKSNAWLFAKSSIESEIEILKKSKNSTSAFTRDRARIILLSLKKFQCKQIAEKTDCEIRKVRNAIKAYNNVGLKALERGKAKGADPKFTAEQKAKIAMIASTDPIKLDLHFTTWSLPKLKRYFITENIVDSISIETIRFIMKNDGINLKKSKRRQYSNDPDFDKKNSI